MNKASLDHDKIDHHWKSLLDALDLGLLVAAEDWSLEFANREAHNLLGRGPEELGIYWNTVLKAQVSDGLSIAGEEPGAIFDFELPVEDKPKKLRLELFPLSEDSAPRALLLRDRDRAESAHEDLRLVSRYRSLGRLYRTMGHDLKAPLNALTINLDLLKTSLTRYAAPDVMIRDRQQRYLKVLEDELARLNRSLQSFLAQAVPPTQETMRAFSLQEVLMDLISLIAPQARQQQVAVDVQIDEQQMTLEGQRDLLKQSLLNMAVNALEAMTGGGRLTIRLETRMGRAVILFQDTGAGIPPEAVEKIWELNYSTKKMGSGVGLYVARSVVESFGGTIGVDSRPGQGTCFTVSLPITLKERI